MFGSSRVSGLINNGQVNDQAWKCAHCAQPLFHKRHLVLTNATCKSTVLQPQTWNNNKF